MQLEDWQVAEAAAARSLDLAAAVPGEGPATEIQLATALAGGVAARQLDRLDAALQSVEYQERFPYTPDLQLFLLNAEQEINHPLLNYSKSHQSKWDPKCGINTHFHKSVMPDHMGSQIKCSYRF